MSINFKSLIFEKGKDYLLELTLDDGVTHSIKGTLPDFTSDITVSDVSYSDTLNADGYYEITVSGTNLGRISRHAIASTIGGISYPSTVETGNILPKRIYEKSNTTFKFALDHTFLSKYGKGYYGVMFYTGDPDGRGKGRVINNNYLGFCELPLGDPGILNTNYLLPSCVNSTFNLDNTYGTEFNLGSLSVDLSQLNMSGGKRYDLIDTIKIYNSDKSSLVGTVEDCNFGSNPMMHTSYEIWFDRPIFTGDDYVFEFTLLDGTVINVKYGGGAFTLPNIKVNNEYGVINEDTIGDTVNTVSAILNLSANENESIINLDTEIATVGAGESINIKINKNNIKGDIDIPGVFYYDLNNNNKKDDFDILMTDNTTLNLGSNNKEVQETVLKLKTRERGNGDKGKITVLGTPKTLEEADELFKGSKITMLIHPSLLANNSFTGVSNFNEIISTYNNLGNNDKELLEGSIRNKTKELIPSGVEKVLMSNSNLFMGPTIYEEDNSLFVNLENMRGIIKNLFLRYKNELISRSSKVILYQNGLIEFSK